MGPLPQLHGPPVPQFLPLENGPTAMHPSHRTTFFSVLRERVRVGVASSTPSTPTFQQFLKSARRVLPQGLCIDCALHPVCSSPSSEVGSHFPDSPSPGSFPGLTRPRSSFQSLTTDTRFLHDPVRCCHVAPLDFRCPARPPTDGGSLWVGLPHRSCGPSP